MSRPSSGIRLEVGGHESRQFRSSVHLLGYLVPADPLRGRTSRSRIQCGIEQRRLCYRSSSLASVALCFDREIRR